MHSFLPVVSISKDVPCEAGHSSQLMTAAWPISTVHVHPRAQLSTHNPVLKRSLPQPSPALHLWVTLPPSHRAKPPVHHDFTYGKAIQKELLKLTGERPQTYNCCVTRAVIKWTPYLCDTKQPQGQVHTSQIIHWLSGYLTENKTKGQSTARGSILRVFPQFRETIQ